MSEVRSRRTKRAIEGEWDQMRIKIAVLVLAAMWVGASCGSDTVDTQADTNADDTTTTSEATTTTAASGGEAAAAYFAAIASSTPTDDQDAIDSSKDGSVARDYAVMQNAMAAAQAGSFTEDETVEVDGDEIKLCVPGAAPDQCNVFTDIEVSGNKVTDFRVNDEDPRTRLSLGGNPVSVAGVTYTPVGAYLGSKTNQLYVAYKVTNNAGAGFQLETFGESYVDSTGQQYSASDSAGPTSPIQVGASAFALATFDGPTPGGQLGVSGYVQDANYTEAAATLEIPAPGN